MCKIKFETVDLPEASCLDALYGRPIDPIPVCLIQPEADLICSATMGPHYADDKIDEAIQRTQKFLTMGKDKNGAECKLFIAPEYFTPLQFFHQKEVLKGSLFLKNSLYILPIECVEKKKHRKLVKELEKKKWTVKLAGYGSNCQGNGFVNSCAIIICTQSGKKIFFQHKFRAAEFENTTRKFCPGDTVYIFQGRYYFLMNFICADLHQEDIFGDICKYADQSKQYGFVTHVQWNPMPNYGAYNRFRQSFFAKDNAEQRYFITCNWASGSKISGNNNATISKSLQTIYRPQGNYKFRNKTQPVPSEVALEISFHDDNLWHCYYFLQQPGFISRYKLLKPWESVPKKTATRNNDILTDLETFLQDDEVTPNYELVEKFSTTPFWYCIDMLGSLPDAGYKFLKQAKALSYPALEYFCRSILVQKEKDFEKKKVLKRIPSAPMLCCFCNRQVDWTKEEQEYNARFAEKCPKRCMNAKKNNPCPDDEKTDWLPHMQTVYNVLRAFISSRYCSLFDLECHYSDTKFPFPVNLYKANHSAKIYGWLISASPISDDIIITLSAEAIIKIKRNHEGKNDNLKFMVVMFSGPQSLNKEAITKKLEIMEGRIPLSTACDITDDSGGTHGQYKNITIELDRI